jgi:acyl-coenzyme A synthetase/AMP-(fatty) acid ligase
VRVIAAFIVASEAAAALPPDAVLTALAGAAEALPAYKRPREWRLVAALPRTANGKITRKALVALEDDVAR